MGGFNYVFDSYIKYNFHVGLAVLALAKITVLDFGLKLYSTDYLIFFLAPFLGYNFIKFHLVYWKAEVFKSSGLKFSLGFILLCYLLLGWVVFYLPLFSQLLFFCTLVLVLLYCLPLPGFKINLRGLKGLKIHLVALSWVFMTVFLPLSIEGKSITYFSLLYGLQRYLFILAATLPFEIRDLNLDQPSLSTWPQKWGIKNTKILGFILLLAFLLLDMFFRVSYHFTITELIAIILMGFILKSKNEQSKYFSSFWVEGIPILWLILKYLLF